MPKKKHFIKINIIKTKHLIVKAKINGQKGCFILDTGASHTCVDLNKTNYFNLNIKKNKSPEALGVQETPVQTQQSKNNKMSIGRWQYAQKTIITIDLEHINQAFKSENIPPIDGIIGADLLVRANAIIDYGKQKLTLT